MGSPMMRVPLQVELRRVIKAASGRPGKVHVIANSTLLCEPITWQSVEWFKQDHERVELKEFTGRQACIVCFARLNGITIDDAKLRLVSQEQTTGIPAAAGVANGPAFWINAGEIWPDGEREIHYILRAPDGWERHKIVQDAEHRKHFDPRLFKKLSEQLRTAGK
jgi:hypothetical protein